MSGKRMALGQCVGGSHHGHEMGALIQIEPAVLMGTTMIRLPIRWTADEARKAMEQYGNAREIPISASYDTYHKRTDKRGVTFWVEGSLL